MKERKPKSLKDAIDVRIKLNGDIARELIARAKAGNRPLMWEIRQAFKFYLENHKAA